MSDHSGDYITIFFHYLFCLVLVGLLTLSLTYVIDSDTNNGVKSNLEKIGSLILKQAASSW